MTQETLNSIINNEEFSDCISDAVPLRVKIVQDLNPQMKEIKKDYESLMIEIDYNNVSSILAKLKADKKDETAGIDYKSWKKTINSLFNSTLKCIQNSIEGKSSIGLLFKAGKMLKYIEKNDVIDKIIKSEEETNSINFKNLSDYNKNLDNDDIKARMKLIFDDAVEVQELINKNNDSIKIDIYNRLPSSVKYDKKFNKSGIKPNNFNSLVKNKSMGVLKDKDKYTKYIEIQISNSNSNIDREEIVLGKTEKM